MTSPQLNITNETTAEQILISEAVLLVQKHTQHPIAHYVALKNITFSEFQLHLDDVIKKKVNRLVNRQS